MRKHNLIMLLFLALIIAVIVKYLYLNTNRSIIVVENRIEEENQEIGDIQEIAVNVDAEEIEQNEIVLESKEENTQKNESIIQKNNVIYREDTIQTKTDIQDKNIENSKEESKQNTNDENKVTNNQNNTKDYEIQENEKLSNEIQKNEDKKEEHTKQEEPTSTEKETIQKPKEDTPKIEKQEWCTNDHNHKVPVGNSGRWFNTENEAIALYNSIIKEWGYKWEHFEIDNETYYKNCPYGYEDWNCPFCGKWTINFYYD